MERLYVNEHDEVLEKRLVAEEEPRVRKDDAGKDVHREEVELDGEAESRNR